MPSREAVYCRDCRMPLDDKTGFFSDHHGSPGICIEKLKDALVTASTCQHPELETMPRSGGKARCQTCRRVWTLEQLRTLSRGWHPMIYADVREA